ncbi:MAG TPA: hypothetical protein VER12_18225 [Polyangiaceae bacterium]|nr:hypothetical protein [Polyangiaceae bacterium]HYQ31355.1 hypothetical protein [Polyangiaceae bacterium]
MKGQIRFQYSCVHDVVTAYVDWYLQTPEDLEVWALQYDSYFKGRFQTKVDLILELSRFRLSPKLAPQFREIRNRILRDYTNRSYRVNEAAMERAMMYAGAILNGGPANQFASMEEALAALAADREAEAEVERGSVTRLTTADSAASSDRARFPSWRPSQG